MIDAVIEIFGKMRFLRFLVSGSVVGIFGVVVFSFLRFILPDSEHGIVIASVVAYILGILLSYQIQRFFVFDAPEKAMLIIFGVWSLLIAAAVGLLSERLYPFALQILEYPAVAEAVAFVMAVLLSAPISYLGSRWIFANRH